MSSPLAGAAVAALIYVDAVAKTDPAQTFWARPSMVTWMSDAMRERESLDDRLAWRSAAVNGSGSLSTLLRTWGVSAAPSYKENSRETLRDEIFGLWAEHQAIVERQDLAKTSSKGRWALSPDFADLFDPPLSGDAFFSSVAAWRDARLSPTARLRSQFSAQETKLVHAVPVQLPNGAGTRNLEPGLSSLILKAVIEQWAPSRLSNPFVLVLSEPGDKLFTADADLLRSLGVQIDVSALLPDAIIADVRQQDELVDYWFVEAVNTDGEISERRREALRAWALAQDLPPERCHYLSAFRSRQSDSARRRLKDLAVDTYAYFADEPDRELAFYRIDAQRGGPS